MARFETIHTIIRQRAWPLLRNHLDILYDPLAFWFNRDPSFTLPIVHMPYHDVRIELRLNGIDT